MMRPLRPIYEQLGMETYYQKYGDTYANPHQPQIEQLLRQNRARLPDSDILDFCAGGGEVTRVLMELGIEHITGCDPFTQRLYQKNIGQPCQNWSFDTAVQGQIPGQYRAVIASFALHLCPETKLYATALGLLQCSPLLVVITPHKRPALEEFEGIELIHTDFALTEKGKKVFWKEYRLGW